MVYGVPVYSPFVRELGEGFLAGGLFGELIAVK
jgi:hypothetical protein